MKLTFNTVNKRLLEVSNTSSLPKNFILAPEVDTIGCDYPDCRASSVSREDPIDNYSAENVA
jgi:hypothetical protein